MKIITEGLDSTFEFVQESDGVTLWTVRAISATTTGNRREYTREELTLGARSLSFRPLNINHDESTTLPYPANTTLEMEFDINTDAVVGKIQVEDQAINQLIKTGKINKLSIEQVATKGETCSSSKCTQQGVTFTGLALLTADVEAGDPSTTIEPVTEAKEDEVPDCIDGCLKKKKDAGIPIDDKAMATCLDECDSAEKECNCGNSDCKCTKPDCSGNHDNNSSEKTDLTNENNMATEEKPTADVSVEETPVVAEEPTVQSTEVPSASPKVEEPTETPLVALSQEQFDFFKSSQQKLLEEFTKALGIKANQAEQKPVESKTESVPSSKVSDVKTESYAKVHEWFDGVKAGANVGGSVQWSVNLDELYSSWGYKSEAVTISSGDSPQNFQKQVIVTPDSKIRVPIRQYCQTVSLNGADRAHFYKMGGVSFGSITEGTEPTNESQTLSKVTATPAIRGAVQRIGYSQLEDVPALTGAINQAFALEAISDEEKLLHTEFDSVSATNWINANSGADITADDVSGMTFKREGIVHAKKAIQSKGYDVSAGNLVAVLHPKAYAELLTDTNLNNFYQQGQPQITAKGALEQIYGVDIVVSANVTAQDNSTNDTYRNLVFAKGSAFGCASARDLQMESSRRNEVQQVIISGSHRSAVKTIDELAVCRVSSAQ